eukprot:TRINITY_DN9020_c0_g1_i12.p1 TRINITY_DN9020_c0_g1~~TRINITY_DN9020_c0_g1_i12.p1  ORF type:complete len:182 (-),score=56.98 TRINITY_DN9020_c0_g1_i12:77-622(-)
MPWLAIPYGDARKEELSELFEVNGIPTLVILNPSTGEVISSDGRGVVSADQEGKEFPWHPKPVNSVELGGDVINSMACLCVLDDNLTDAQLEELKAIGAGYWAQWQSEGKKKDDYPLCFLYGPSTSGLGKRILDFLGISEPSVTLVIDIPESKKYINTDTSLVEFISSFLNGTAAGLPLKD